jgi:hypothetical protein
MISTPFVAVALWLTWRALGYVEVAILGVGCEFLTSPGHSSH